MLLLYIRCYDRFREMNEELIDANVMDERVDFKVIVDFFPELKANPFGLQLCRVFASSPEEGMTFEDFLDMVSVLSEHAPTQIKADWAFRLFDFDEDGLLKFSDIQQVVYLLCGGAATNSFSEPEMERIVRHVLQEAEGRQTDAIGPQEFRNIMSRSPDFALNFTIRF